MSRKTVILVSNDEVAQYEREFSLLCDRLAVCEEIREGYYSDEARVGSLFDMLTTAEEKDAAIAALELPGISANTELLTVLKAISQLWRMQ